MKQKFLWLSSIAISIYLTPLNAEVFLQDTSAQVYSFSTYQRAEVITWRNESVLTLLRGEHIIFRKAFFSPSGYNGSFIVDGTWSPKGSFFAFRLLSSGGHMPYRNPVKIFHFKKDTYKLIDAESILRKIPNISNISVSSSQNSSLFWVSDSQLKLSVISHDKKSDSGRYLIDLIHMKAKKITHSQKKVIVKNFDRKAILDTLRKKIKMEQNLNVVFVVRYLKFKNGWAWIHALPQSKNGKNHYEDIFALLTKEHGRWRIVEIPCRDEENPECLTYPAYFSILQKRFPNIPSEILPRD